jgi:hypothetical protein
MGHNDRGYSGVPPVQAATPIFVSAFLMLMPALLFPLGLVLARRIASPQATLAPLSPLPTLTFPRPTRHRLAAQMRARLQLRAPPTFPDHSSELNPSVSRAGFIFAALAPSLVVH